MLSSLRLAQSLNNKLIQMHSCGSFNLYYKYVHLQTMKTKQDLLDAHGTYIYMNRERYDHRDQFAQINLFLSIFKNGLTLNVFDSLLTTSETDLTDHLVRLLRLNGEQDQGRFLKLCEDVIDCKTAVYSLDHLISTSIQSKYLHPYTIVVNYEDPEVKNLLRREENGKARFYNFLPINGYPLAENKHYLQALLTQTSCYKNIFYLDDRAKTVACKTNVSDIVISGQCHWYLVRENIEIHIIAPGKEVIFKVNHFHFVERFQPPLELSETDSKQIIHKLNAMDIALSNKPVLDRIVELQKTGFVNRSAEEIHKLVKE